MDYRDAAQALLEVVGRFIQAPSDPALRELRRRQEQLLGALEPPRPDAAERDRVRRHAAGVPSVDALSDADVALALQLSDRLRISELLSAKLVADTRQPGGESLPAVTRLEHAAQLFTEARVYNVRSLHGLLLHYAAAELQLDDLADDFDAFIQELLSERVGDRTALQYLAALVQDGAPLRSRRPPDVGALAVAAPGGAFDVLLLDEEAQVVVLLAECLFFAASVREQVSRQEVASMLGVLGALTSAGSDPAAVCADARALAVLFAVLAALESTKLSQEDCDALQASMHFLPDKHDVVTALLRVALGLCSAAGAEALLQVACDDGAFGFLLQIVESPSFQDDSRDWPDAFVITAHTLVSSLLLAVFDSNGGVHPLVEYMRQSRQPAFVQLMQVFAALYRQGPDDLPNECVGALWEFIDYGIQAFHAEKSPTTLMPLLELLLSLAPSQPALVWSRLHSSSAGTHVLGDVICVAILNYCKRFAGDTFGTELSHRRPLFPQDEPALREMNVSDDDAEAMIGYLRLLQRLIETSTPEVTHKYLQHLQATHFEGQPAVYIFFVLIDSPVTVIGVSSTPKLKAALFDLVGAFASDVPSAAGIWEYLEKAAVVQKPGEGGFYAADAHLLAAAAAGARNDILYELNEVEARAETYPETLAFIRLVNKLIDMCETFNCGPAVGGGAVALHVFHFVRDTVFANMDGRAYKNVAEKWQLTAACLEHFRLVIQLAPRAPQELAARTPGRELLLDFENGPVLRGIFNLLHGGAQHLEEQRPQPHGAALEGCIGQALAVLLAVFDAESAAAAADVVPLAGRFVALLLRDRRRLSDLFSYVQYAHNVELQAAAVRIVHEMAKRDKQLRFVQDPVTSDHLKRCMTTALRQGLQAELTPGGTAHVIARLLVDALPQPVTPNLGHLLLGMPDRFLNLQPALDDSCLPLLLDAVSTPLRADALDAANEVLLRERVYRILWMLASDPRTSAVAVPLLCAKLDLAADVAGCADLEFPADPFAQTSLQHHRASLLQLVTVVLHHSVQLGHVTERVNTLLCTLFLDRAAGDGAAASGPVLKLLECAASAPPVPPALDAADAELADKLGLRDQAGTDLLSTDRLLEDGVVCVRTERDVVALRLDALDALAQQRAAEQRLQPGAAFFKAMLLRALLLNNWHAEREASLRLLSAWSELVCVAVTDRCAAALKLALQAPGAFASTLVGVLSSAVTHLPESDDKRANDRLVALLRACHVLLRQLHVAAADEHAELAAAGVFAGALSPTVCRDVLRSLLSGLLRSGRCATTRYYAYNALLAYLRLCRPPRWARSAVVSRALMAASAADVPAAGSAARLELDAGNLDEFRRQGGQLMSLLAREAVGGSDAGRALALALVQAVLSMAEGAGAFFEPLLFQPAGPLQPSLPAAVAGALEHTPRSALLLPPPACTLALATVKAQLSFLLGVALDTPSGPAQLIACGVVPQLTRCGLIDALLEQRNDQQAVVREHVFLPALRLITTLLAKLPDSRDLEQQAAGFVAAHHDVLLRALSAHARELGSGHLHETQLTAELLCTLCARDDAGAELARFRVALECLCWELFVAREAVAAPQALRRSQPAARLTAQVWRIQGTLAAYLRRLVLRGRAVLSPATGDLVPAGYSGVRAGPPTLLLLAQLLSACADSFTVVLDERRDLLASLSGGAERMAVEAAGDRSRVVMARELLAADADTRALLHLLENALQVVHWSLHNAAHGEPPRPLKQRDAELLSRELRPALDKLARVEAGEYERDLDLAFMTLLLRRCAVLLREADMALAP